MSAVSSRRFFTLFSSVREKAADVKVKISNESGSVSERGEGPHSGSVGLPVQKGVRSSRNNKVSDILPHSTCVKTTVKPTRKVCDNISTPRKESVGSSSFSKSESANTEESTDLRVNDVNIQMLSDSLWKQIFGSHTSSSTSEDISKARDHLRTHGLLEKETSALPHVSLKLPMLSGSSIDNHFKTIAEEQGKPYKQLLSELLCSEIPKVPREFEYKPGWTKYLPDGSSHAVPFPEEKAIVFDVEVCQSEGQIPTLATAVSSSGWYSWVSQHLFNDHVPVGHRPSVEDMIPLESSAQDLPSSIKDFVPRIVVGHNVAYDRARVKEQYWFEGTRTRFLDTMSLHISISGITSYQRAQLVSDSKKASDETENVSGDEDSSWMTCSSLNNLSDVHQLYCGSPVSKEKRDVFVTGSFSDIRTDFQQLMMYCARDVVATYDILKEVLPLFFSRFPHPVTFAGMLELSTTYLPVNSNWKRYIRDADDTYEDLANEVKLCLMQQADEACSYLHENTFEEDPWLWDLDWSLQDFKLKKSKTKNKGQANSSLNDDAADGGNNLSQSCNDEEKEPDHLEEKFMYLSETELYLPARYPHLPGYPVWYRKLCPKFSPNINDWQPGPQLLSTSMKIVPKLLRLTWENSYPLQYSSKFGWGFYVPIPGKLNVQNIEENHTENTKGDKKCITSKVVDSLVKLSHGESANVRSEVCNPRDKLDNEVLEYETWRASYLKKKTKENAYKETGLFCYEDIDGLQFYKLPHKDGPRKSVGNPLAKDFLNKVSDNTLSTSAGDLAKKVLSMSKMLTYWRNNHQRIKSQLVVQMERKSLPRRVIRDIHFDETDTFGAIIPQVIVCGTLTRRAVEPTWLTASNAYPERIGSELRAIVQAPPGYHLVGADVDSQELWIASVIGDAHFAGIHGCTALGWMTLQGKKNEKTDMHSMTASAVGISRDQAKIINYARIYGAGQQFAEQLLLQFNPSMSKSEAKKKAQDTFSYTKGHRTYRLRKEFLSEIGTHILEDKVYSRREAFEISKTFCKTIDDAFCEPHWEGGTESAMFNRLEEIATSENPSTPFLGCRISRALEPEQVDDDFLPTRINWVVQSSAVDFLHLMLVCMRWLIDGYLPGTRFCVSFHDEVRYLVPTPYRYEAALALHITNLLTRAFCSYKLGIRDLPQSVAFFSSVDVDKVLRKEVTMDCKTPSNPHGLSLGYGIPTGESVDIYSALEKTSGTFQTFKKEAKPTYKKKVYSNYVRNNKKKACKEGGAGGLCAAIF